MIRGLALALLLAGCAAPATAEPGTVVIPAPGVALNAAYALPPGPAAAPAVVALHGCGGPWAARDGQWRDRLVAAGHPVLLPDSFGSRGLGSQCTNAARGVSPGRERKDDTVAAVQWLVAQPGTPAGGLVVMGWSNGGSTVLAAANQGVMPPGLVRGYVAFYPGCRASAERPGWAPSTPLLIVMGEDDDWTPAAPCKELAARFPDRIKLVLYPGAYHDFDAPNRPLRVRRSLPTLPTTTAWRMPAPTRRRGRRPCCWCRVDRSFAGAHLAERLIATAPATGRVSPAPPKGAPQRPACTRRRAVRQGPE